MREGPGPAPRLRDADQLEQLDGTPARIGPADLAIVDLDSFRYLVADGVDGCQRRHRVLKYGADHPAADL